jgi:hypothetical protein
LDQLPLPLPQVVFNALKSEERNGSKWSSCGIYEIGAIALVEMLIRLAHTIKETTK